MPIVTANKTIVDGSCSMIELAKVLAANPEDTPSWQALAKETKNVSDGIKALVITIR